MFGHHTEEIFFIVALAKIKWIFQCMIKEDILTRISNDKPMYVNIPILYIYCMFSKDKLKYNLN